MSDQKNETAQEGAAPVVYAVAVSDYDYHGILAVFTTEAAALAYVEDWNEYRDADAPDVRIERYPLDPPRRSLPGCWWVCVDANGNVVESDKTTHECTYPDRPATPLAGKRENGAVMRGYGLTVSDALASARAALAEATR